MHYSILHLLFQQAKFTKGGPSLPLPPEQSTRGRLVRRVKEQPSLPHTIKQGILQKIPLRFLPLIAAKSLWRQGGYFLLFWGPFLRVTCIFCYKRKTLISTTLLLTPHFLTLSLSTNDSPIYPAYIQSTDKFCFKNLKKKSDTPKYLNP